MTLMEKGLRSVNPANTNLHNAKRVKNDEFYTRYKDIEAEVMKYRKQFRDKVVYLPCDDPIDMAVLLMVKKVYSYFNSS